MRARQATDGRTSRARVVSFFAGCGGLDLGFKGGFTYKDETFPQLDFEIVRAYELDARCKTTYEANLGAHFELCDLGRADISAMPQADVLIGGFPCQEFSICGPRRGVDSARGGLFRSMSKYARLKRPKVIVAENVAHITRLNDGADFLRIKRSFAQAGYRCNIWRMYAPDYGIPQARERVVLVFVRKDLPSDPLPPEPTFKDCHRSVEWAIGDLIDVTDESVPNQSQYFKANLAASGHGQGDELSPRDQPGYTVRANAKSRVQFHYELPRRLTVRECARLQTFPDAFVFPHAATANVMQIGNAVPPMLAHVVANSIQSYLANLAEVDVRRSTK